MRATDTMKSPPRNCTAPPSEAHHGHTATGGGRESAHASDVGQRVLAGFLKGRTQVNLARKARGTRLAIQVHYLVLADQGPPRGRARRIRQRLGGTISERYLRKIITRLQNCGTDLVA